MAARTPIESFRAASLLTRTLVTVTSLLGLFAVFVTVISFAAVTLTKSVFPPAGEQSLASQPGASEAEDEPGSATPGAAHSSPGRAAPERAAPAKARGSTAKRNGDPKE